MFKSPAKCIRCGEEVPTDEGLTLAYNQDTAFVKVCENCEDIVRERRYA